jgi:hypothetical protein
MSGGAPPCLVPSPRRCSGPQISCRPPSARSVRVGGSHRHDRAQRETFPSRHLTNASAVSSALRCPSSLIVSTPESRKSSTCLMRIVDERSGCRGRPIRGLLNRGRRQQPARPPPSPPSPAIASSTWRPPLYPTSERSSTTTRARRDAAAQSWDTTGASATPPLVSLLANYAVPCRNPSRE